VIIEKASYSQRHWIVSLISLNTCSLGSRLVISSHWNCALASDHGVGFTNG
jgi:hypothetical protein